MDKNDVFEFDAPKTFTNLYEMANAENDGADEFFDLIAQKMGGAKSEPSLEVVKEELIFDKEEAEENKENFAPDDVFYKNSLNSIAHQLIRSAKKSRSSKLHNRHSITVEGIEVELPRVKHHAMITRLDELENTPKLDLRSRSVVKSEYKYQKVSPGSNVLKPRSTVCLFSSVEMNITSSTINADNTNEKKQLIKEYDENSGRKLPNINFNLQNPLSSIKMPAKTQSIKVLNTHDGVQVVENKELGHGGIKVQEKQLHTVPIPFSFESRKSCAITKSNTSNIPQQWLFKARPATVLKKKPFVPKHEKKYTEPKDVKLNTERRAKEWIVFEQELKEKFSHYEEIAKKRQEESKKEEMRVLKNLRQQTVHKPIPIKKYKPVVIKRSEKPVTVPHSPRFSVRPHRGCMNNIYE